ncbi:hypothetical protein NYE59_01705 [Paenibacillus sp. FSL L8-0323]|uniref:hypothetical protein n=1 Tax=Paenibacillus sp. FSL L8-0323 TaxID=2975330 RepID=UPI0030F7D0DD
MYYNSELLEMRKYRVQSLITIFLFITPFVMLMLAFPADAFGWFLLASSYFLLLTCKEIRSNANLFFVSFIVLTLHHIISFMNAYIGTTLGADTDAMGFHVAAQIQSSVTGSFELKVGSGFYIQMLAYLYKAFGPSQFTGQMTSAIGYVLSSIVFIKLMTRIGVKRHQGKLLFLFGALPTVFFLTTVILRESWEILSFLLIIYTALGLRNKKSLRQFVVFFMSVFMLALLHNGMMAFAPVIILLSFLWIYSKKEGQKSAVGKRVIAVLISCMAIGAWFVINNSGISSTASSAVASGSVVDYANAYRDGSAHDSRASYGISNSDSSLFGLVKTFPLMLFYYMFAPLPWQISNIADVYAAIESLFRFLLLYFAYKTWKKSVGEERRKMKYLLLTFIALECLWSLGTINWGTAMRHHLVGYGLLLLVAGPEMFDRFNSLIRKK